MTSPRPSQTGKSTEQRDQIDNWRLARMTAFGQAGNAGKIKPFTLDEMAKRYEMH